MRKTTRADFARFKKTFRRWQDRFGLNEWDVAFEHNAEETRSASISCLYAAMDATTTLGAECDDRVGDIDDSGFHEAAELLLIPLLVLARDRKWDEEIWEAESHRVIHRLARAFGVIK